MNGKITVVYMIGTLDVGGTEGQLVRLARLLDRSRFDPVVCCLSSDGPYEPMLAEAGVPVMVLGFRGFTIFRHPHRVIAQLLRLYRWLRQVRPTIVHGFLFWAYVIGAFSAAAARVPIFISSRRSLGTFKATRRDYLFLERQANRLTDLVIANSEAVRQDALQQEGLPPEKVIVVHNGLDVEPFQLAPDPTLRASLDVPDGAPLVVVLANFIYYKGYEFFIEAWSTVLRRFPRAVALLVGDGSTREAFEERARTLGLAGSLRFLGTRRDVPALLALADVMVHPSLQEGFSNAILEAMAAGKAVVATEVGGNPEAVLHGETGLLVPAGDSAALAAAIEEVLEKPEKAAAMGAVGRRRVEEHFELTSMVRRYEEIYTQLVEARGLSGLVRDPGGSAGAHEPTRSR